MNAESKTAHFDSFVGLYPVSKTLRFELIPIGKTSDNLKTENYLQQDFQRAKDYVIVKRLMDDIHKKFISECLKGLDFNWDPLSEAIELYNSDKNLENKNILVDLQKQMRTSLVKLLKDKDPFIAFDIPTKPKTNNKKPIKEENLSAKLFDKNIFKILLSDKFCNAYSEDEIEAIKTFDKFSTYFKGYHNSRKNIYSDEEISTAISYRIVHDNFPKFLNNIIVYKTLNEKRPDVIKNTEIELAPLLNGKSLDSIFTLEEFNNVITQEGIQFYNTVLGGWTGKDGSTKMRGINEFSNLYIQEHKDLKKIQMTFLFKQILSEKESFSYIPEEFDNDEEILKSIQSFYKELVSNSIFERINGLFQSFEDYNFNKLFISQSELTRFSKILFDKWDQLPLILENAAFEQCGNKITKKKQLEMEKNLKRNYIDFETIADAVNKSADFDITIFNNYFNKPNELIAIIKNDYSQIDFENVSFSKNKESVRHIKNLMDDIQELFHILKIIQVDDETDKDISFYGEFDYIYEIVRNIVPLFNKTRNYVTKKKFNQKKIKLNFNNPTLADGWDLNKEIDNTSIIFRKNGLYYLGIMNPKKKTKFSDLETTENSNCFQKMEYKLLPDPKKMLPKVFFSKKWDDAKTIPELIKQKYAKGIHKKGNDFNLEFCHELIDYFKKSISEYEDWNVFEFKFSDTSNYNDMNDFYNEISEQGYKLSFRNISTEIINKLVDENQLYLFQIYNKDFSPHAKGRPNMHTKYWKSLFSNENLKDTVFKLNGQAELFFRPRSDISIVSHLSGEKMVNKIGKDKSPISESVHYEIFNYENGKIEKNQLSKEAQLAYANITVKDVTHEIIKDRRYTVDKYLFHVPITINHKVQPSKDLNLNILKYASSSPNLKIIGIDRGERNLIYVSLIDKNGNLIYQDSFNVIDKLDYQIKLNQREQERDVARKSWSSIETIKDLKEGYLSQVVHKISEMIIEHNAIVILEDLTFGFKRGRFKVEKQVYQKFEKMLIDKLNYLVFKQLSDDETGGVLRGYQLTLPFESFSKMSKQTGILFYVPAAYTSKIDPTSGFVNLFSTKDITNHQKRLEFFSKFDSIRYCISDDTFIFKFDYTNFPRTINSNNNKWEVCSVGKRICVIGANGDYRYVEKHPTSDIKNLLDEYNIDYTSENDILKDVIGLETYTEKLIKKLFYSFKESIQMRNSNPKTGEDYILSPVKNKHGLFYDSRNVSNKTLPVDADANGAYHIALKGLFILQNIPENFQNLKKVSLPKIEHSEWLNFVQARNGMTDG